MADYQLTATEIVTRTADGASIPNDPGNRDRQEYDRWLADGGVPDPYVPPTPTPRAEADAHLAGGLTVDFLTRAAGVGTYAVTGPSADNINSIATSLALGHGFPGGKSTVEIFNTANEKHDFDNSSFQGFAKAVRDFVHASTLYAQGEATELPPNSVTIAETALQAAPACSVYSSAAQTIPANTPTKIQFDTAEFDVTSAFDLAANSLFQPTVAGYYMVNCGCGVAAGAVQNFTSIYKNGEEYRRSTTSNEGGNTRLSTLVHLNGTTDYVEGFVRINKAFNTIPGGVLTSFSSVLTQPG